MKIPTELGTQNRKQENGTVKTLQLIKLLELHNFLHRIVSHDFQYQF